MAGTFSQIYIQIVFAVQNRACLIHPAWEEELYKYITGITQHKGQKMLAVNGMPDHIHLFIGMKPSCCLSDLVREIKKATQGFIVERKFSPYAFNWQEGYGAFSYSYTQVDAVVKYILHQKDHHRRQNFREEYEELLRMFNIAFKAEYLFDWL